MTTLAKRKESDAPPAEIASSPMVLLDSAIKQGVPVETLERLTALYERWEANRAREAFGTALAAFQAEMPPIQKKRRADRFSFAGFDDIMRIAGPLLAKHDISVAFDTAQSEGNLFTVVCRIRVGGYHEDRTLTVPIPKSLKVSEPQQFGAAVSYAKRYCLCAALNIVVTDEDNETALDQPVTTEMMAEMKGLIEEKGVVLDNFLSVYQVDSLSEMTVKQYRAALPLLRKRKAGGA